MDIDTSLGGDVEAVETPASPGQEFTVRATAHEGYVFDGWTSQGGGGFTDLKNPETTFTMPANNVIITANFVPEGAGVVEEKGGISPLLIFIPVAILLLAGLVVLLVLLRRKGDNPGGNTPWVPQSQMPTQPTVNNQFPAPTKPMQFDHSPTQTQTPFSSWEQTPNAVPPQGTSQNQTPGTDYSSNGTPPPPQSPI